MTKERKRPKAGSKLLVFLAAVSCAAALDIRPSKAGCPVMKTPAVDDRTVLVRALERYPATIEPDPVSICFIGDVMLHKAQIENSMNEDGSFDFSGCLDGIAEDLTDADLAVANMEFTLAGPPYSGYPSFCAPDEYAVYAAGCGIDVFLTANNHILDKGERGLKRTLEAYRLMEKELGIRMTGSAYDPEDEAGRFPLMLEVEGFRIGIVNFTYGTNAAAGKEYPGTFLTDRKKISEAIKKAEELDAGLIIALPHWGEEYRTEHSAAQEELARWLAENGADLIIGTHPHVVQDTGVIPVTGSRGRKMTVPVVYSLGNAISNMSARNTQIGLLLTVRVCRDMWGRTTGLEPDYTFTWTSLPGRLGKRHCTVKVKDYLGKREKWKTAGEYDKMVSTYYNIKRLTGIED